MGKTLTDLTFDAWVKYIFAHAVTEPTWYSDPDADTWNEEAAPGTTTRYLTRAFENIRQVAMSYTDAQLNQGLWYIVDSASSAHLRALLKTSVPLTERLRAVRSIYTLNEHLFLPRCSEHLGHMPTKWQRDENPLNSICFMWWDVAPISPQPGNPERAEIDAEILDTMRRTLMLDSLAVQEGALHGLSLWRTAYPDEVTTIVDTYLAANPEMNAQLRNYALRAKPE